MVNIDEHENQDNLERIRNNKETDINIRPKDKVRSNKTKLNRDILNI